MIMDYMFEYSEGVHSPKMKRRFEALSTINKQMDSNGQIESFSQHIPLNPVVKLSISLRVDQVDPSAYIMC